VQRGAISDNWDDMDDVLLDIAGQAAGLVDAPAGTQGAGPGRPGPPQRLLIYS
jgi:hypothetical protein